MKDAYFHIAIYSLTDHISDSLVRGCGSVLPFGLSVRPRVFIRCIWLSCSDRAYLKDLLLFAQSKQEAWVHTHIVMKHLAYLGFVINMETS